MDERDDRAVTPAAGGDEPAVARAWAAFEEQAGRADEAPPGFAARVLLRLKREGRAPRAGAAPSLMPAWLFSAIGAAVAGAIGGVLFWYGTQDPAALTAFANAAQSEQTINFDHLVAAMGGLAGVAAALGALGYYYLVPRR